MKRNSLLLLTLVFFILGCQKDTSKTASTPNPEELSAETEANTTLIENIKICLFKEEDNRCQAPARIYRKLQALSHSGVMTTTILDLNEIRQKYLLTDQMVQCLKAQHCKENEK